MMRFHTSRSFRNTNISNLIRKLSISGSTGTGHSLKDESKIIPYLKSLSGNPNKVISTIESGWKNAIMKAYMKDSNVDNAQSTANASNASNAFLTNASVGSSPNEPLYMVAVEPSFRSQAWKAFRWFAMGFLLLSYFIAVVDEKSGPGGIAQRLGMATIIHQAITSDKTFDDVVGVDEAKADLQEIVMYLKDPSIFTRLGGRLPKGVLLTGPPGTGKTLLARAIAGEAGVPFFYTSGSEFEEMYVGVGARRVRDLFNVAKSKSPCIIFIDEIDAIGGSRHLKEQTAMKMTLNQLLVEMDGFENNPGVVVIAATNFADSLDSALVRPGRFDKHVEVPLPDIGGRKQILELYGSKVPLSPDVDILQLARGTPGFSGADLSNLINQAALKSSLEGMKSITMQALEYAKDKIMMGAERKSAIVSPETMKVTAYHEAGHALIALKTDGADPVHKATIMPRGRSLGMVMQLPEGDQTSMTRKQMIARLDVCMGGRVAEELIFGADNVTSGASSDIQQATRLAKAMVTKYGLSPFGTVFVDEKEKLGDAAQGEVDDEIRKLLRESYNRSKNLLESNRDALERIAKGLLEFESLSGQEVVDLMNGRKINSNLRSQKPSRDTKQIPLPLKSSLTNRS